MNTTEETIPPEESKPGENLSPGERYLFTLPEMHDSSSRR